MVHVDADFAFEETFTTTGIGGPPQPRIDEVSQNEWLFGFYAQARVNYWLSDVVAIYLGADVQVLDDFTMQAANREVTIDFGSTFGVTLGVLYSF
jgi:hypothetical protein